MGGRPLGSAQLGDASQMPNHCPAGGHAAGSAKSPAWNGWGVDVHNTRFQDAEGAGITRGADPGPEAEMGVRISFGRFGFWAAFGGCAGAYLSAPISGTSIRWICRRAASIGRIKPRRRCAPRLRSAEPAPGNSSRYAVYVGDMQANVYALDAPRAHCCGPSAWRIISARASRRRPRSTKAGSMCPFPLPKASPHPRSIIPAALFAEAWLR